MGTRPRLRNGSAGGTELIRRRALSLVVFLTLGFTIGAADPWTRTPWVRSAAEVEAPTPLGDALTTLERRAETAETEIRDLAHYHATTIAPLMEVLHRRTRADSATIERAALALAREGHANGLDPRLLLAVMLVENPWLNPTARSHMGAVGMMQVMPFHAGKWGCESADLEDLDSNICHGAKILAQALRITGGDLDRALLRYNGCVYGTNTPDCHQYPQWVYARAEPAWVSEMQATLAAKPITADGPNSRRNAESTTVAFRLDTDAHAGAYRFGSNHGKHVYVGRFESYAAAALTGTGRAKQALSSLVAELTVHVADGSLWPVRTSSDVSLVEVLETLSPGEASGQDWIVTGPDSASSAFDGALVVALPLTAESAIGSPSLPTTTSGGGHDTQPDDDLRVASMARLDAPRSAAPELVDGSTPTSRSLASEVPIPDRQLVAAAAPSKSDDSTPISVTTGFDTEEPRSAVDDRTGRQTDAIPRDAWEAVIGNRILKAL